MFSSLKIRNYRLYWSGMFISFIGSWIQTVAQSWLMFQLTNSAFLLGLVGFVGSIPVFLLSLFGGVAADRINKRAILIFTQITFMILAFILAILTHVKLITPLQIMFIAALNGVVMAFDAPARQAVVAELVGKENLFNAVALNSVAFNSSRVIGPSLAGILVAVIGISGCFYLNGVSFLAAIAALLLIKINSQALLKKHNAILDDLVDGLRFIKNNRPIFILIMMVGMVSLFGISYIILMPIFADRVLNVGVKGLGVLMAASGVGASFAALMLARLDDFKYKGRLIISSAMVFSVSLVLFALSKSFLFSIITLVLIGASGVCALALINTLLQTKVSDEYRGRVMSGFMFTFAGIMPFGHLIIGSLAHAMGVSMAVMISGVICTVFFITINALYPQIRRL